MGVREGSRYVRLDSTEHEMVDRMKKVGILTFHRVHNFGAILQAWSLVQVLKRLGTQPEILDYRPGGHERKGQRQGLRRFLPSIGAYRMERFRVSELPIGRSVLETRDEVDRYVRESGFDALICGSDQVWFKDSFLGFDRTYLLDVGDPSQTRRISYAPSSGPNRDFGSDSEEARSILLSYSAVSVRDANTLELTRTLGIPNVERVVDPTLLADFSPLISPESRFGDYLVVVGKINSTGNRMISEIARSLELKVLDLGKSADPHDYRRPFVSPREWVDAIAHARFVVTSLFHGTAVSLSLRRPFVALDTQGRSFKITDLLEQFDLGERFVSTGAEYSFDPSLCALDYTTAEPKIQAACAESMRFLQNALES